MNYQVGGIASTPDDNGSTFQLVQAMAGFGGDDGASDSLSTVPLGADTSQQQFLATPHV